MKTKKIIINDTEWLAEDTIYLIFIVFILVAFYFIKN